MRDEAGGGIYVWGPRGAARPAEDRPGGAARRGRRRSHRVRTRDPVERRAQNGGAALSEVGAPVSPGRADGTAPAVCASAPARPGPHGGGRGGEAGLWQDQDVPGALPRGFRCYGRGSEDGVVGRGGCGKGDGRLSGAAAAGGLVSFRVLIVDDDDHVRGVLGRLL